MTDTRALPSASELDAAIATIGDSRRTHLAWIRVLEAPPGTPCSQEGCDRDHHADAAVAGDLAHHQAVVAAYDQVLGVLRHVRALV